MQRITSLSCTNFMTFPSLSLDLDNKTYIIKGENKDDQGQQSNGSGKTSLVEIIAIVLLGQSLTGRDLKDCCNWNGAENFFTVSLTLRDSTDDDENVIHTIITRKIYNNTRSSELSITRDSQPVKGLMTKAGIVNGVDIKEGNKYILETLLNISKEDLLNYYLISGGEYTSFFKCNNGKKIEIINRFSKAGVVDKTINRLSLELKEEQSKQFTVTTSLANLNGNLEGLRENINQGAIKQFEENKQQNIQQAFKKFEEVEQQLVSIVIKPIKEKDFDKLIKESGDDSLVLKEFLSSLTEQKNEINQKISSLKVKLAGEIACPKCDHHFILKSKDSVSEMKKQLETYQSDLNNLNLEILDNTNLKLETDKIYDRLILDRNKQREEIQSNKFKENQKVELQRQLDAIEQSLIVLDQQSFDDSIIREKITVKEKEIKSKEIDLESIKVRIDQLDKWIERFKQFKFYLANKPIEIICHYINEFLRSIDSEFSVEIEGFKTLKSGELRAELNPIVYRNGLNPKPYSSFSEGEKVRLNIAADLALQRLVNENSNEGLLFYCSDEALNSVDSLGLVNIAKAFNKLSQTILLITHSGSDLNYDFLLTVQKKNNISTII